MTERIDITGQCFGRLIATRFWHTGKNRQSYWLCRCSCGEMRVVSLSNLRSGNTTSCGCFRREATSKAWTKHGHARTAKRSPEYQSWVAMWARVRAATGRRWRNYGARGIRVCERWISFDLFLVDMGRRPKGRSLDRIDNDGNYEPGNCRWATASQQNKNQRRYAARPEEEARSS